MKQSDESINYDGDSTFDLGPEVDISEDAVTASLAYSLARAAQSIGVIIENQRPSIEYDPIAVMVKAGGLLISAPAWGGDVEPLELV